MDEYEAMQERHSVRSYYNREIEKEKQLRLQERITQVNLESGLNIQLVVNEPKALNGFMASYGLFSGVRNYLVLVGERGKDLQEKCGYYGEQLVLLATQLGLQTCWVALTYNKVKSAYKKKRTENVCAIIAIGYGGTKGKPHKSKEFYEVCDADEPMPGWFRAGVEASLLAPTALNKQNFKITLEKDDQVRIEPGRWM